MSRAPRRYSHAQRYPIPAAPEDGLLALLADLARPAPSDEPAARPLDLSGRLAERLGGARAQAWLRGVAVVHEYLTSECGTGTNAIDDEHAAIVASRRALLPAFQCRMQERVDRADAATADNLRCAEHDCAMHSQGRGARSWQSTLGDVCLERRQSVCWVAGEGNAPADYAVGLPARHRTARCRVCWLCRASRNWRPRHSRQARLPGMRYRLEGKEVKNAVIYTE